MWQWYHLPLPHSFRSHSGPVISWEQSWFCGPATCCGTPRPATHPDTSHFWCHLVWSAPPCTPSDATVHKKSPVASTQTAVPMVLVWKQVRCCEAESSQFKTHVRLELTSASTKPYCALYTPHPSPWKGAGTGMMTAGHPPPQTAPPYPSLMKL